MNKKINALLGNNFRQYAHDISTKKIATSVLALLLFAVLLFLNLTQLSAQTTVTFSTAGTATWTAPCGVTSVNVRVWGGGGSGGATDGATNHPSGGGGGGGYSTSTIAVTPGNTYSGTVGAGGAVQATSGANGNPGQASTMFGITANGGGGGGGWTGIAGVGGVGGTGTTFNGGNGAAGQACAASCGGGCKSIGGGGGEGACTSANGANASGATGGSSCDGGNGGNSSSCFSSGGGLPGVGPGGGGAGSINSGGAAGGVGQIVISFTCPLTLANAGPDQTLSPCTTTATVDGNNLVCAVSSLWSIVSGTGTLSGTDPATLNGMTIGGITTLRWTINTGATPTGCGTYTDDVVITSPCPANTLNAGADQTLAQCATSAALAANTLSCGSGTWTKISGAGSITTPTSPTSAISGLTPGASSTFRWTWTFPGGLCGPYTDDVVVTVPNIPTPTGVPTIINSQCQAPCTLAGGSIAVGGLTCSSGTLQYSIDGGTNWTTLIPTYNQTTPVSFIARCNCAGSGGTPTGAFSTTPGVCVNCPPSCSADNGTLSAD